MKRILVVLAGVAAIAVAAVFITPVLIPGSAVKDQLANYVRQSTGRQLQISGDGRFQLFPSTGVTFEGLTLSGPDGDAQRPFLRAEAVTAELDLLSLVGGGISFDALTLDTAIIDLRTNPDGSGNWEFSAATPSTAGQPPAIAFASTAMAAPSRLSIHQIKLRNSTVRYHAPEGGATIEMVDANVALRMPASDRPATLSGGFSFLGETFDVDGTLETPARLRSGARAALRAEISGRPATVRFDGHITPERGLAGTISASSDQPATVFALAGATAAPALKRASMEARLDAAEDTLRLSDLRAALDDMTATGELAVSTQGSRPALTGQIAFDTLNLDAFRLQPVARDTASTRGAGLWPAHAAPGDEIALKLDGLDALNANLDLTAGTITRQALTARDAAARVRLRDAVLAMDLSRLQLYGGRASGDVDISDHQGVPVISARLNLVDVDALPLFADVSDFDWLSGRLNGGLKLASGGATLGDLRARLQGSADMRINGGALEGLDLPGMLARLQAGEIDEFGRRDGVQTEFSRLAATWAIRDGVAKTDDLQLEGPFVTATGSGTVDARQERLDLKLQPRISPRASEAENAEAIEMPLRIQGAWANPKIYPDVEEVLKDPEKSLGAAKNFGKAVEKFTGGKVSEDDFKQAIDGLFGKKQD